MSSKPYTCKVCIGNNYSFRNKQIFLKHMQVKHRRRYLPSCTGARVSGDAESSGFASAGSEYDRRFQEPSRFNFKRVTYYITKRDGKYVCSYKECSFSHIQRERVRVHMCSKIHAGERGQRMAHSGTKQKNERNDRKQMRQPKQELAADYSFNPLALNRGIKLNKKNKMYVCPFDGCSYSHNSAMNLRFHFCMHTGSQPHNCLHCSYKSVKEGAMKRHLRRKHNVVTPMKLFKPYEVKSNKTVQKPKADYSFNLLELARDIEIEKRNKRFICPYDGCRFSSLGRRCLMFHYCRHTGSRPHSCLHCSYKSVEKSNMKSHIWRKHHVMMPKMLTISSENKLRSGSSVQHNPTTRQQTLKTGVFEGEKQRRKENNMQKHLPRKREVTPKKLFKPYEVKTNKTVQKPKADYSFNLLELARDIEIEKRNKRFICPYDGCRFSSLGRRCLMFHYCRHTGARPHSCLHCSYKSVEKCNMKSHIWRKHHVMMPKMLTISSENKLRSGSSVQHNPTTRQQTLKTGVFEGEKRRRKENKMQKHLPRKREVTPKKLFKPYEVKTNKTVQKPKADYSFNLLELVRDIEIEKRNKRFICPFDGCRFSSLGRRCLMFHYCRHTGSRPHSCLHCSYKSVEKCNMKSHIWKKHHVMMPKMLTISSENKLRSGSSVQHNPTTRQQTLKTGVFEGEKQRRKENNMQKHLPRKREVTPKVVTKPYKMPSTNDVGDYSFELSESERCAEVQKKNGKYHCSHKQCNFSHRHKCNVIIHMCIHSGYKPYQCLHCLHKSIHSSTMRNHLKKKHHVVNPRRRTKSCKVNLTKAEYSSGLSNQDTLNTMIIRRSKRQDQRGVCSDAEKWRQSVRSSPKKQSHKSSSQSEPFHIDSPSRDYIYKHVASERNLPECKGRAGVHRKYSCTTKTRLKKIYTVTIPKKLTEPSEVKSTYAVADYSFELSENERNVEVHKNNGKYYCSKEQCNFSHLRKSNVIIHMCIHSGSKPYRCLHCSYRSIQIGAMKSHLKNRHHVLNPKRLKTCKVSSTNPMADYSFEQADKDKQSIVITRRSGRSRQGQREVWTNAKKWRRLGDVKATPKKQARQASSQWHVLNPDSLSADYVYKPIASERNLEFKQKCGMYSCPHAGCSFISQCRSNVKAHVRTHTGLKPYSCCHCQYTSAQESNMKIHVQIKHKIKNPKPSIADSVSQEDLGRGIQQSCQQNNMGYSVNFNAAQYSHNFKLVAGRLQCPQCGYLSQGAASVVDHMEIHSEGETYSCLNCGLCTADKHVMQRHVKHQQVKRRMIARLYTNYSHKRKRHICKTMTEGWKKCRYCEKMLCCLVGLKLHIQEHNDKKRYRCKLCFHQTVAKQLIISHIKKQHRHRLEKTCPVAYKQPSGFSENLFKDSQKRTAVKSDILSGSEMVNIISSDLYCSQFYTTSLGRIEKLISMKYESSDSERYHCTFCGRSFANLQLVLSHTRLHTGETPYQCKMCDYRCAFQVNIERHLREKHVQAPDDLSNQTFDENNECAGASDQQLQNEEEQIPETHIYECKRSEKNDKIDTSFAGKSSGQPGVRQPLCIPHDEENASVKHNAHINPGDCDIDTHSTERDNDKKFQNQCELPSRSLSRQNIDTADHSTDITGDRSCVSKDGTSSTQHHKENCESDSTNNPQCAVLSYNCCHCSFKCIEKADIKTHNATSHHGVKVKAFWIPNVEKEQRNRKVNQIHSHYDVDLVSAKVCGNTSDEEADNEYQTLKDLTSKENTGKTSLSGQYTNVTDYHKGNQSDAHQTSDKNSRNTYISIQLQKIEVEDLTDPQGIEDQAIDEKVGNDNIDEGFAGNANCKKNSDGKLGEAVSFCRHGDEENISMECNQDMNTECYDTDTICLQNGNDGKFQGHSKRKSRHSCRQDKDIVEQSAFSTTDRRYNDSEDGKDQIATHRRESKCPAKNIFLSHLCCHCSFKCSDDLGMKAHLAASHDIEKPKTTWALVNCSATSIVPGMVSKKERVPSDCEEACEVVVNSRIPKSIQEGEFYFKERGFVYNVNNTNGASIIPPASSPSVDNCPYDVSSKGKLKYDIKPLSDDLPYKCKYCTFSCSRGSDMIKHLISTHKAIISNISREDNSAIKIVKFKLPSEVVNSLIEESQGMTAKQSIQQSLHARRVTKEEDGVKENEIAEQGNELKGDRNGIHADDVEKEEVLKDADRSSTDDIIEEENAEKNGMKEDNCIDEIASEDGMKERDPIKEGGASTCMDNINEEAEAEDGRDGINGDEMDDGAEENIELTEMEDDYDWICVDDIANEDGMKERDPIKEGGKSTCMDNINVEAEDGRDGMKGDEKDYGAEEKTKLTGMEDDHDWICLYDIANEEIRMTGEVEESIGAQYVIEKQGDVVLTGYTINKAEHDKTKDDAKEEEDVRDTREGEDGREDDTEENIKLTVIKEDDSGCLNYINNEEDSMAEECKLNKTEKDIVADYKDESDELNGVIMVRHNTEEVTENDKVNKENRMREDEDGNRRDYLNEMEDRKKVGIESTVRGETSEFIQHLLKKAESMHDEDRLNSTQACEMQCGMLGNYIDNTEGDTTCKMKMQEHHETTEQVDDRIGDDLGDSSTDYLNMIKLSQGDVTKSDDLTDQNWDEHEWEEYEAAEQGNEIAKTLVDHTYSQEKRGKDGDYRYALISNTMKDIVIWNIRGHTDMYKCPFWGECNRWYENKEELAEHLYSHQKNSLFSCCYCGLISLHKELMMQHLLQVHGVANPEAKTGDQFSLQEGVTEERKASSNDHHEDLNDQAENEGCEELSHESHCCHICGMVFLNSKRLTIHTNIHRSTLSSDKHKSRVNGFASSVFEFDDWRTNSRHMEKSSMEDLGDVFQYEVVENRNDPVNASKCMTEVQMSLSKGSPDTDGNKWCGVAGNTSDKSVVFEEVKESVPEDGSAPLSSMETSLLQVRSLDAHADQGQSGSINQEGVLNGEVMTRKHEGENACLSNNNPCINISVSERSSLDTDVDKWSSPLENNGKEESICGKVVENESEDGECFSEQNTNEPKTEVSLVQERSSGANEKYDILTVSTYTDGDKDTGGLSEESNLCTSGDDILVKNGISSYNNFNESQSDKEDFSFSSGTVSGQYGMPPESKSQGENSCSENTTKENGDACYFRKHSLDTTEPPLKDPTESQGNEEDFRYLEDEVEKTMKRDLGMQLMTHGSLACVYCGRVYVNLNFALEHMRIHTKSMPYQCCHCDYKASKLRDITIHVGAKHIRDHMYSSTLKQRDMDIKRST